jgi:hypothetical protein
MLRDNPIMQVAVDFNLTLILLSSHRTRLLAATGKILTVLSDHDQNNQIRIPISRTMVRKWSVFMHWGVSFEALGSGSGTNPELRIMIIPWVYFTKHCIVDGGTAWKRSVYLDSEYKLCVPAFLPYLRFEGALIP